MDPIQAAAKQEQEGVDALEWDPTDPSKKKVKKSRKYSFDLPSNKKQTTAAHNQGRKEHGNEK